MKFRLLAAVATLLVCGGLTAVAVASSPDGDRHERDRSDYEVWLIDQSNTRGSVAAGNGGYLSPSYSST